MLRIWNGSFFVEIAILRKGSRSFYSLVKTWKEGESNWREDSSNRWFKRKCATQNHCDRRSPKPSQIITDVVLRSEKGKQINPARKRGTNEQDVASWINEQLIEWS